MITERLLFLIPATAQSPASFFKPWRFNTARRHIVQCALERCQPSGSHPTAWWQPERGAIRLPLFPLSISAPSPTLDRSS
ncbi:hypothetical protein ACVJBD_003949 [Rhizobium mongolense]